MIGVEVVKDPRLRTPDGATRDAVIQKMFERGVLCLGAGESTIRLTPPLIVSKEEADTAMDTLEESVRE